MNLLDEAFEIIDRIGTTGCGCESTEWLRRKEAWINEFISQNTSTNSAMPKCPSCGSNDHVYTEEYKCTECDTWFVI